MNVTNWRTPALVLACGSLILMLSLGTRQSFGLFLQPMSMDLGWGRETFAFALALQNLVWGLAQPFAGMIADKFGAARIIVVAGAPFQSGGHNESYGPGIVTRFGDVEVTEATSKGSTCRCSPVCIIDASYAAARRSLLTIGKAVVALSACEQGNVTRRAW
jgi:hypothetical protein